MDLRNRFFFRLCFQHLRHWCTHYAYATMRINFYFSLTSLFILNLCASFLYRKNGFAERSQIL